MAPPVARKDLDAENAELKKSLAEMEKTIFAFRSELKEAEEEAPRNKAIASIEERFSSFEAKFNEKFTHIIERCDAFEERLDDLEQYSRRNCLLLHGIPEKPKEDCIASAIAVFRDEVKVSIGNDRVDWAHRVGPPRSQSGDKPRPIIVKFISYQDRRAIWINKKSLKGSGFLITESLTKSRQAVLQAAKHLVGPRNAWTQDGKIFFLRPDGSRASVTTMGDIEAARARHSYSHAVRSRRRN